jgi:hypothetical protein
VTFSERTGNEVMVGHSDHLFVISLPLISFLFRYCVDVFTHFVAYPHFPTLLSDFSASELFNFWVFCCVDRKNRIFISAGSN